MGSLLALSRFRFLVSVLCVLSLAACSDDDSEGGTPEPDAGVSSDGEIAGENVSSGDAEEGEGEPDAGTETGADTPVDAGGPGPDAAVEPERREGSLLVAAPPGGLRVSEAGGQASFTVLLGLEPTDDVLVEVTVNDASEARVEPGTLRFDVGAWQVPGVVTVTGVDDLLADGDVSLAVELAVVETDDEAYQGVVGSSVLVLNTDDDTPGVTVGVPSAEALAEGSSGASLGVSLDSEPADEVRIPVSVDDASQLQVSPDELVFDGDNWDTPQQIAVTPVDDDEADGDVEVNVILGASTSNDADYAGIDPDDTAFTVLDNDVAGLVVDVVQPFVFSEVGAWSWLPASSALEAIGQCHDPRGGGRRG